MHSLSQGADTNKTNYIMKNSRAKKSTQEKSAVPLKTHLAQEDVPNWKSLTFDGELERE